MSEPLYRRAQLSLHLRVPTGKITTRGQQRHLRDRKNHSREINLVKFEGEFALKFACRNHPAYYLYLRLRDPSLYGASSNLRQI